MPELLLPCPQANYCSGSAVAAARLVKFIQQLKHKAVASVA